MVAAVCRPESPGPDRRGKGLGTARTDLRMPAAAMEAGIVAANVAGATPFEEALAQGGGRLRRRPGGLPRAGGLALVPAGHGCLAAAWMAAQRRQMRAGQLAPLTGPSRGASRRRYGGPPVLGLQRRPTATAARLRQGMA